MRKIKVVVVVGRHLGGRQSKKSSDGTVEVPLPKAQRRLVRETWIQQYSIECPAGKPTQSFPKRLVVTLVIIATHAGAPGTCK